ncbi:MAG: hypothetical protein DIU71_05670 [Proteobacteria bacterium]|nr:MAG: hypothetical protein DIU71_05670 [Pseudomonadota bacterium]
MNVSRHATRRRFARAQGLSLIELLVALAIGAALIYGATKVYVDSRGMYEVNETAARLQETARYALSVLEPDIRMSNYWGLVKGAGAIGGQTPPPAGTPTKCGATFASDLMNNIEGTDGAYTFACAAFGNGAVETADTLTIRRAAVTPASGPATGRLRICSTRLSGELVSDTSTCTPPPGAGQINDLIVNGYYVSRDSEHAVGLPALRRHQLIAGPDLEDVEIIPGVEDMQIQFGVDPSGLNGTARRYVDPDELQAGEQVVSVRIWLLVRAETPEVGFTDDKVYEYGGRDEDNGITADLNDASTKTAAYKPEDGFRRLLVSRTIQIRNALGT